MGKSNRIQTDAYRTGTLIYRTWAQLSSDMEPLSPSGIEGRLLKMGHYPEESSVSISHEKARELAVEASGKRTGEINTCVLIESEPHPVWKLRVIADDPADQVIELDAETGEVVAVDMGCLFAIFKFQLYVA